MTYEEETVCRQQPGLRCGCQVHAVLSAGGGGSSQKKFVICQYALDPGLMLCARITDKSYVNLAKQKSCSFNILTRVGTHALHGSKIKD